MKPVHKPSDSLRGERKWILTQVSGKDFSPLKEADLLVRFINHFCLSSIIVFFFFFFALALSYRCSLHSLMLHISGPSLCVWRLWPSVLKVTFWQNKTAMQPLQHLLLQPKYYDTIAEVLMHYLFQLHRTVSRETHFCPPQMIFVLKVVKFTFSICLPSDSLYSTVSWAQITNTNVQTTLPSCEGSVCFDC